MTAQNLKKSNYKYNLSEKEKKEVFTSSIYNEFKNLNFFKDNVLFEVLFNNLEVGLYNNSKLIKTIKNNKLNEKKIKDLEKEKKLMKKENKILKEKNKKLKKKQEEILNSNSWKITKPLRMAAHTFKK